MSKETEELIKQLKALTQNIDILTKVTAINIGKEEPKEAGEKTKVAVSEQPETGTG